MSDTREAPITATNEVAAPRISRRRAAITVIVGLTITGVLIGVHQTARPHRR